jgi:signal transduction histidine kinase
LKTAGSLALVELCRYTFGNSSILEKGRMISRHLHWPEVKRYFVSILLVLAAAFLTIAIVPFFQGKAPLTFYTIAVIVAAAYGGLGPGLLATALAVILLLLPFQSETFFFVSTHSSLTAFAVVGIAVSVLMEKQRRSNAALIRTRDELRAATEKLSERTEDLSHSNQELQRFAYGLAHDLYNPLRSVSAFTELLIQSNAGKLDVTSMQYAGFIVSGAERMESMIKGLLDYAVVIGRDERQVLTDCNLVLERVLQDLLHEIATSGAAVKSDALPAVQVNYNHLVQVFSNLISNSIKYRGPERPQIHVSAADQGADWMFSVKDNGEGFDMQHASEIFGMFKRLQKSDEGVGVGLALCKAVIERHGGKIWAESARGVGSTFFFTLPKSAGEELPAIPKRAAAEETPHVENMRARQRTAG